VIKVDDIPLEEPRPDVSIEIPIVYGVLAGLAIRPPIEGIAIVVSILILCIGAFTIQYVGKNHAKPKTGL
jgi:hypothetical protein